MFQVQVNDIARDVSWVFEHTDRAVILEDDCLPVPSFFAYCRTMLILYEHEQRVFSISGSNFSDQDELSGHAFSRYSLMWGWATWADRWNHYILDPTDHVGILLRTWWYRPIVLAYWMLVFRNLLRGWGPVSLGPGGLRVGLERRGAAMEIKFPFFVRNEG